MNTTTQQREHLYIALVNVRNTELSVYWTRYNIMAVINLGILAAVLSSRMDSLVIQVLPCVAAGGILLGAIWFAIAVKGKQLFTQRWEEIGRASCRERV